MKSNSLYSTMVANVLIKFGWHRMKTLRGVVVLKFPAPYGPVLTKISKCHRFFNFWHITKKVIAYNSPWLWYFAWSLVEIGWNCWRSSVSKIVESEILQRAPNDPKPNSRNQTSKVPCICILKYHKSQNFHPLRSMITGSHFRDVPYFRFSYRLPY